MSLEFKPIGILSGLLAGVMSKKPPNSYRASRPTSGACSRTSTSESRSAKRSPSSADAHAEPNASDPARRSTTRSSTQIPRRRPVPNGRPASPHRNRQINIH